MDMTLEQYIMNPMGKKNAVMSAIAREGQRTVYKHKFDQVMLREHGKIAYTLYEDTKNNTFWAHIKVPSESVEKFVYDVVFKFYADAETGTKNDLFKWNVKFFSNDPAFVYTYAYVFNEKELLVPELKSKMSNKAMKEAAKEKNPENMVGYVKIIYFAYLLMENKKLNQLSRFKNEAIPLAPQKMLKDITPADEKIEDRQAQKVSHRKKRVYTKNQFKQMEKATGGGLSSSSAVTNVATTKKVGTIKNVNSVKGTRGVKRK